jgi:asparagine synthase (glutamine-hydrolysing)
LTLASDSVGGRPLYFAIANGLLFFSTSLPLFKRLTMIPRTVEVGSYIEQEALCYPLGDRTVYRDIKVMVANECLVAGEGKIVNQTYYDWASVPAAEESTDELARYCQRAVRDAIACRARPGTSQTSLLSGGLDSRVLVAHLVDAGYEVNARNVAREGFQDEVYARRFAETAGVQLSSVPWSEDLIGLSAGDYTARLLRAAVAGSSPGAVFSGDGGGETLGFLLMNREAARLLNEGRVRAGVDEYLRNMYLSKYLFTSEVHRQLLHLVQERMEQELREIGSQRLEKALHILVLTNDLRRHLHDYFDQITESRVELLLPFYDRRVIESVVRIPAPLEPLLKHQFYHRVIGLMPPIISSVPWQTYPGHAACPVEDRSPPPDQWSQPLGVRADRLAARSVRFALSRDFVPFLRRSVVLAAAALHWTRVDNFGHLFRTCINLHELCGRNAPYVIRDQGIPPGAEAYLPESNGKPAVLSATQS